MSRQDEAAATTLQLAVERLARSRQLLRDQLLPAPDSEGPHRSGVLPRRLHAWLRAGPIGPVMRTLDPWLGTAQRTLARWWRRHPWRPTVELAGGTLEQSVVPWVRRHPVSAMGLGAAAGIGLALAAPWRWKPLRQAVRGSSRGIQRWAFHQLSNPAAQAVLASVVASVWTAQASARKAPQDGATTAPAPQGAAADDGATVAPSGATTQGAATAARV